MVHLPTALCEAVDTVSSRCVLCDEVFGRWTGVTEMDDENGDNQGFGWVWAGVAAIIVILMLLGAALLLGWVRIPFVG